MAIAIERRFGARSYWSPSKWWKLAMQTARIAQGAQSPLVSFNYVCFHIPLVTAENEAKNRLPDIAWKGCKTFTWPCRCEPTMEPPAVETMKTRVLVVDDNPDVANSLSRLLTLLGHDARAVYCGQDAINTAGEWCPHLVLVDLNLPDLPGYEVAKAIRAILSTQLKIVAVTGWMRERNDLLLDKAGFDGYLTKPPSVMEISRYFPDSIQSSPPTEAL